ncbi:MAG: hypothetical protein P8Y40_09400 [Desulfobacterales bacterium]
MKKLAKVLSRLIEGLTALTGWVSALCLVAAAFIITEAVIVRKIFGVSTIWQTEASVFLLILTVFVPLWIPYLFLPLGMTLLFLQYIVQIYGKITAFMQGNFDAESKRKEV